MFAAQYAVCLAFCRLNHVTLLTLQLVVRETRQRGTTCFCLYGNTYGGVESEACIPVRLGVGVRACIHAHVGVIPESDLERFLGETNPGRNPRLHKVRNGKTLVDLVKCEIQVPLLKKTKHLDRPPVAGCNIGHGRRVSELDIMQSRTPPCERIVGLESRARSTCFSLCNNGNQ